MASILLPSHKYPRNPLTFCVSAIHKRCFPPLQLISRLEKDELYSVNSKVHAYGENHTFFRNQYYRITEGFSVEKCHTWRWVWILD